jgi:DNA (cytosine-5)-methyltransferase 1
MILSYGSVCSGIEAASVAWHDIGFRPAWFAEIEKFPSAVLGYHYPLVPNLGDMTTIANRVRQGEVEAPDVLVGGTPCQAYSVAGLRGGMADPRGALTLSFVTLGDEIDRTRKAAGLDECVIVWENVPGVLSSKDNAFGCFLASLAGESQELQPTGGGKWANAGFVSGPKRQVAWRILDAQYFGVAQRRRRLFVIASARKGFSPLSSLFEFDGLRRDTAPSRDTGQEVASTLTRDAFNGGAGGRPEGAAGNHFIPYRETGFAQYAEGVGTLKASGGALAGGSETLSEQGLTTSSNRMNPETETFVTYALQGSMIGREDKNGPQGDGINEELSFTLNTIDRHAVAYGAGEAPDLAHPVAVRRLTCIECERLQGFPDGYTLIPWRKKPADQCPDGPRYKALGNSMAVPVMRWLGVRIYLSLLGLL